MLKSHSIRAIPDASAYTRRPAGVRTQLARPPARPGLPSKSVAARPGAAVAALESVDSDAFVTGPMFARGTYGSVHLALAVDNPDQRLVAKKLLVGPSKARVPGADNRLYLQRNAEKIFDEIGAMHAVKSPLRPQAYQVGAQGATLVMPYCEGDMEAINASDVDLTRQSKRAMLRSAIAQTSAELGRIHAAHYLHLDVKPSNLFFDGDGRVCMGDFGLAHPFSADTPLKLRRGTPAMMAPEALLNKSLTPKAETWSLFVTWLDLAVGTRHNAFVTEPAQNVRLFGVVHGNMPFGQVVDAEDSPFRTFFDDLQSFRASHPGPLDPQKLASEPYDSIAATLARAWDFDPQMTALGWEHALAQNPDDRLTPADLSTQIRALQPHGGRDEARARQGFCRLAAKRTAHDKQFAALRREAAAAKPPQPAMAAGY